MFHYILLVLSLTIQGNQTILGRQFAEFIQTSCGIMRIFFIFIKKKSRLKYFYSAIQHCVQIQFIPDVEHLPSNLYAMSREGNMPLEGKVPTTYPLSVVATQEQAEMCPSQTGHNIISLYYIGITSTIWKTVFTFW